KDGLSGPLLFLEVALRDPVFWRLHKFIDNILQIYKNTAVPPYKPQELLFDGVNVNDIAVQSISGNIDELHTFRSYIETNYTMEKERFCVYQPQLNHDPFKYQLSIESNAKKSVNIRIYMAPVHDDKHKEFTFDEQRNLWALMDRFSFV
ncbi:unnamed protein product, partial [Meganyctiphanes norvegica]